LGLCRIEISGQLTVIRQPIGSLIRKALRGSTRNAGIDQEETPDNFSHKTQIIHFLFPFQLFRQILPSSSAIM
jgi:hypothetical protein